MMRLTKEVPMKTVAILTGLLVLTSSVMGMALSSAQPPLDPDRDHRPREPLLSVSGRGEVNARPDRATVILGAVAQSEQAGEAQRQVNRIMQQAFEQIRQLEIPEEAITTVGLSLEPVYSRPGRGEHEFEPRIVGFRARNAIRVRVDELGQVGPVIDAGVAAGANQLQGLHFELRDDRDARREALRQAVQDARLKAEAISQAMGLRLEQVMEVAEADVGFRPPEPRFEMARMASADAMPTPVQPGQVQITASVVVRYRIAGGDANR
jgi:uncharacterized protein